MTRLEVLEGGVVDRGDAAFPTLVRLDNGEILCGFSRGGGAHAQGGTHCARSSDEGRTWIYGGTILERAEDPVRTNHLRLSRTADGTILAYGQRDRKDSPDGVRRLACDPVLCRSTDGGRTWSAPEVLPFQIPGPYEISNPIVVTADGRWLAPAATLYEGRYGERVVLHESLDRGATWPHLHTVFQDPGTGVGYLEQKLIEIQPGRLLATAWVQDFAHDTDLDNAYALSSDGGRTWEGPHPTGIHGQTMTPIALGGGRTLVLYNQRVGHQGIRMCLVRIAGSRWTVEGEGVLFDAQSRLDWSAQHSSQAEIGRIRFGYPMGLRLASDTVLAVHWCAAGDGVCEIRWARLRIGG